MSELFQDCWEDLCNAVVEQAAKDYYKALKALRGYSTAALRGKRLSSGAVSHAQTNINRVKECEQFFEKYCEFWTDIDGTAIRNEILKQSGMNEEILNQLIKKNEEENYESKTGTGISKHGRTENVHRANNRGEPMLVRDSGGRLWSYTPLRWVDRADAGDNTGGGSTAG